MGFEIQRANRWRGCTGGLARLLDPNFHQTLVYVAEHGPDGTLGLVMNRPARQETQRGSAVPRYSEALRQIPVYQGGPVKTNALLFARFRRGKNDEQLNCQIVADPQELIELPNANGYGHLPAMRVGARTTRARIERGFVAGVPAAHSDAGRNPSECYVGGVCGPGPAVEEIAAASAEEHRAELASRAPSAEKTLQTGREPPPSLTPAATSHGMVQSFG